MTVWMLACLDCGPARIKAPGAKAKLERTEAVFLHKTFGDLSLSLRQRVPVDQVFVLDHAAPVNTVFFPSVCTALDKVVGNSGSNV